MALVKVATKDEIPLGMAKIVEANGLPIAIYNVDGTFYATTNTCVHQGGSLGEGELEDNVITCPLHGWKYDVTSGVCQIIPSIKIPSYKVEVRGEDIFIEV